MSPLSENSKENTFLNKNDIFDIKEKINFILGQIKNSEFKDYSGKRILQYGGEEEIVKGAITIAGYEAAYKKLIEEANKIFNTHELYKTPEIDRGQLIGIGGEKLSYPNRKKLEDAVVGFGMVLQVVEKMMKEVGLFVTSEVERNIIVAESYKLHKILSNFRSGPVQNFINEWKSKEKENEKKDISRYTDDTPAPKIPTPETPFSSQTLKSLNTFTFDPRALVGQPDLIGMMTRMEAIKSAMDKEIFFCHEKSDVSEHLVKFRVCFVSLVEILSRPYYDSGKVKENIKILRNIRNTLERELLLKYSLDSRSGKNREVMWNNSYALVQQLDKVLKNSPNLIKRIENNKELSKGEQMATDSILDYHKRIKPFVKKVMPSKSALRKHSSKPWHPDFARASIPNVTVKTTTKEARTAAIVTKGRLLTPLSIMEATPEGAAPSAWFSTTFASFIAAIFKTAVFLGIKSESTPKNTLTKTGELTPRGESKEGVQKNDKRMSNHNGNNSKFSLWKEHRQRQQRVDKINAQDTDMTPRYEGETHSF